jgi:hypothetical protein
MRHQNGAWLLAACCACGCHHTLEINNPPPPIAHVDASVRPVVIGVKGGETAAEAQAYVDAVAKSLQLHAVAQRVVYPWTPETKVDVVAEVKVTPEYKGSGYNFLINFPGFLVFAPAWHGYVYHANPRTRVELRREGGAAPIEALEWEHDFVFNQADIGRTWTEISWFEYGVIALVSGAVFTRYDTDQTPDFIKEVAPGYGDQIATLIANRLAGPPSAPTPATSP